TPWPIQPGGIRHWLYLYRKEGFEGLKPKTREKGQTYRLTPEQQAQILAMKHKTPRRTVQNIYHSLVCTGELCATKVSLATVQRFVRQQRKEQSWEAPEDRRTFEMPYANDMWEIDSSPGPYLYDAQGKNPKRLTIIAAIDDASRLKIGRAHV